ncbi:unnamed protein product [Camellia sinensis]
METASYPILHTPLIINNNCKFHEFRKNHFHFLPLFSSAFSRKFNFPGKSLQFKRFTASSSSSSSFEQNPSQDLAVLLEVEGVLMDVYRLGNRQAFNVDRKSKRIFHKGRCNESEVYNYFVNGRYEGDWVDGSMSKNGELYKGCWVSSGSPSLEKMKTCKTNMGSGLNWLGFSSCDGSDDGSSGTEPQDADYSYIPSLDYELEGQILARIPRSEYWKLCLVNRRCLTLLKSGELFKIRRELGVKESSVLMAPIGENSWWACDREFKTRRKLPNLQTDFCFISGDKESFCAGTHLLVSGREVDGLVTWRYELAMNRWCKGPLMITPRCLFASATCGTFAFVAGGVGIEPNSEVYDTAEKYNPETKSWEPLQRMKTKRKLCAGCYMDNKFYVIGGRNEDGELTCGEFFDEEKSASDEERMLILYFNRIGWPTSLPTSEVRRDHS